MYRILQEQLQARISALVKERYGLELPGFAVELPPKIEFGEMALTVALPNDANAYANVSMSSLSCSGARACAAH